jgi:hypothetical protein
LAGKIILVGIWKADDEKSRLLIRIHNPIFGMDLGSKSVSKCQDPEHCSDVRSKYEIQSG